MTTLRRFTTDDLFSFNNINLDPLTATYSNQFYLKYMSFWPDFLASAISPSGRPCGYIIGKAEGEGQEWHGHVTAVTVAPEYRKIGLATKLMDVLEDVSEKAYNGFFVDLYVRKSNEVGIRMYRKFGYVIYRRVLGYYSGDEDAYDMRKSLARDPKKLSEQPYPGGTVHPYELTDSI